MGVRKSSICILKYKSEGGRRMSDINSLRAQLREQENLNRELREELNMLILGVNQAENEMSRFRNYVTDAVQASDRKIMSSHEKVIRAYEIQGEIDKLYVRFKNMELANKKIRECNNKKYYEFGNYRTVRKIVQGIMDNMNVNMVSDGIIYKSVEKQHLQTPDYWLTCVLLSIVAWKNDDKMLAERAMERALILDKKNSAIFYMLFNIRIGREETALKWFEVYQECELKGSDERTFLLLFSLLSKTLDNLIDERAKYEIYSFINKVIAMNAKAEGFSEEVIVQMIESKLEKMCQEDILEFTLLKKCCDDYNQIARTVILAQNNVNILQFILDVGNVSEVEKNEYLSSFIDEQIGNPNDAEISVYDEIRYNEIIIACGGEMERAEKIYQEEQEKKKKDLNLIAEMIHWVYDGVAKSVGGQVRKNMFVLTKGLQTKAVETYAEDYRKRVTAKHPITLGEYKTTADFTNLSGEKNKIEAFYNEQKMAELSNIKNTYLIVGIVLAVLGIAGFFYLGPIALALTGIGIVLSVGGAILNSRSKKQIEETCLRNISGKQSLMTELFEEYSKMIKIYEEYDAYYERIENALKEF